MIDQLLGASHEIGRKVEEFVKLRTENEKLRNELKSKRDPTDKMNRSQEIIMLLDEKLIT